MNKTKETQFLHALATPLSIALISIKQELKLLEDTEANQPRRRRLQRALEALRQIEILHADHKGEVFKAA